VEKEKWHATSVSQIIIADKNNLWACSCLVLSENIYNIYLVE